MLIPTGGPSNNPHQIVPPWIGLLRTAARTRQLEQEPPPAPLEDWPPLGLATTDDPKERMSLSAYATHWLHSTGRDAARYLSEGLARCASGLHSTSTLENTLHEPRLHIRITRHLAGHLGKGAEVLAYDLTPQPGRHGAWPVVCVRVRGGRLECGDLPRPADFISALHQLNPHDIAADAVAHLTR